MTSIAAKLAYEGPEEDAEMSQICCIEDAICKLQEAKRFYDQPSPKFSQAEGCIEDAISELNRTTPGIGDSRKSGEPSDDEIMDVVRQFASDGGRWPSDWLAACRAILARFGTRPAAEPVRDLKKGANREIVNTYVKLHEGKIGAHWLWCAIEQINAGIPETEVMRDYGYSAAEPSQRGSAGEADEDIQRARKLLARLCDHGLVSMSIPVDHARDEDMLLSRIIERAALSRQAPAAPAEADTTRPEFQHEVEMRLILDPRRSGIRPSDPPCPFVEADPTPAEPAKWIDDPHDIEQGQMLNPEWLKFHGLTAAEARAAHNAGARLSPDLRTEPAKTEAVALRPAPKGHHPDCVHGCSHSARSIAGPCESQCVKTPEFHEQSSRAAQASQTRFATQIGANVLTVASAGQAAGLTIAQIDKIWHGMGSFTSNDHRIFARAIERAHGINVVLQEQT